MPLIEDFIIKTFDELAFKMSDQQDYIIEQLDEISTQFHASYMTQLNKKLKEENKQLKVKLSDSLAMKLQNTLKNE